MTKAVQQGVILAAGRGSRLQPFTATYPKVLLPICNKPIMQYQIEAMRDAGISDIAVVISAAGQLIRDHFGDGRRLGVRLSFIDDPDPRGIASSLARVEGWVRGPFAVFLGDIFLALDDISAALEPLAAGAAGTLVVRRDTPEAVRRNFAVLLSDAGQVERVIEKPADPPTDLKGCGVYVFDRAIFEAIRATPRSALRNEYEITDAVQILISMGRPLFSAEVVRWDVNVTFPADLLDCNLRLLREQRLEHLVEPNARVNTGARLRYSIVGSHAEITAAILFEECLVLPGARVAQPEQDARRMIFGRHATWSMASAGGIARAVGDPGASSGGQERP
ncbi:MAG: NTP transferase domain-containing protein [Chloroflexales bacterium]|nr:NTP transferase domain-containing protein [Chloroflexales bacterium]